jgi:hypothetical protein
VFLTDCFECGLRELRGARSIELLANTGSGMDLVYRCTRCGTGNVLRAAGPEAPATAARPAGAPVAA